MALGERFQLRHRRRVTEDVDRQEASGPLADGVRGGGGIKVERLLLDIDEDWPCALVEQAVGRSDEAERAGDDLVTLAPAEHPHPEVQRGGAAGGHHRVLDPEPGGELPLEPLPHLSERKLSGPQHREDQLLLASA